MPPWKPMLRRRSEPAIELSIVSPSWFVADSQASAILYIWIVVSIAFSDGRTMGVVCRTTRFPKCLAKVYSYLTLFSSLYQDILFFSFSLDDSSCFRVVSYHYPMVAPTLHTTPAPLSLHRVLSPAVLSGTKYQLKQARGRFGLGAKMVAGDVSPLFTVAGTYLVENDDCAAAQHPQQPGRAN